MFRRKNEMWVNGRKFISHSTSFQCQTNELHRNSLLFTEYCHMTAHISESDRRFPRRMYCNVMFLYKSISNNISQKKIFRYFHSSFANKKKKSEIELLIEFPLNFQEYIFSKDFSLHSLPPVSDSDSESYLFAFFHFVKLLWHINLLKLISLRQKWCWITYHGRQKREIR